MITLDRLLKTDINEWSLDISEIICDVENCNKKSFYFNKHLPHLNICLEHYSFREISKNKEYMNNLKKLIDYIESGIKGENNCINN